MGVICLILSSFTEWFHFLIFSLIKNIFGVMNVQNKKNEKEIKKTYLNFVSYLNIYTYLWRELVNLFYKQEQSLVFSFGKDNIWKDT